MAENKQYIEQVLVNGTVKISEDVIAEIVSRAVCDVEGVVVISTKPGADIAELIGKKNWGRGLKISVNEDSSVSVDCNIIVNYGQAVVNIANAVQAAVIGALETITGVKIAGINVNVCGIVRQ